MSVTVEYISQMREELLGYHQKAGRFIQSHGSVPAAGSQAFLEQTGYSRPQSILTAFALGTMLIEYGGEHLTAFVKTVTEPAEAMACWTCVRSMLESCALSAWLLDPAIEVRDRVQRVFALRFEGLEQQLKFGKAINQAPAQIAALEAHIDDVASDALSLGFPAVLDRHGRRIGIGQVMPNATNMIGAMLDEEIMYRMLSGVAHGHFWAISQLSMQPSNGDDLEIGGVPAKPFEKTTDLKGIAILGVTAFKALSRPLWNQCRYFGWPALQLEELLENSADALKMTEQPRFWRS